MTDATITADEIKVANKLRYENAEQLIGCTIVDFQKYLADSNINEIMVVKSALGMIRGEMNVKLHEVMRNRFVNIGMTEEEYSTFCSFLVSIGGMINNVDFKLQLVDVRQYDLMPDCFKGNDIEVVAEKVSS